VRRVIIAARDPNPQVTGGGAEFLAARGVDVAEGLLAAEARRLNEAWFHYVKTGRPWVHGQGRLLLDGKIATVGGEEPVAHREGRPGPWGTACGTGWTPSSWGSARCWPTTPRLTTRLPRGQGAGRDPIALSWTGRLRLPLTARLLNLDSEAPPGWPPPARPRRKRSAALKARGTQVLVLPATTGRVSLPAFAGGSWGTRQVQSLLVEGGAETLGPASIQKLVNQF